MTILDPPGTPDEYAEARRIVRKRRKLWWWESDPDDDEYLQEIEEEIKRLRAARSN